MATKLLIFGITGDLSRRKLLPALRQIMLANEASDLEIIGISRREVDVAALLNEAAASELSECTSVFTMNLASPEDYLRLHEHLHLGKQDQVLAYLSVPPGASAQIVDLMGEAGLNGQNVKILFEKPFGMDLASAEDFIARTARYYQEAQLYRIDHYLAKEMAQNIVAFRGGNALFSHLWNNQAIERIEVVAYESITIEGRAQFYEQTGALRDFIQGHLLQLLALTIMDIPHHFDWSQLPELRLAALEALRPADPKLARRAQYRGYQEEAQSPGSGVETFASLTFTSSDPRWEGVPMQLITGKALPEKRTEVRVHLKKAHEAQSNLISFRIQPDEGIAMRLYTKTPGYERTFEERELGFRFPEDVRLPDAYEQVLVDALRGQKNLFTTSAEVERSWQLVDEVQQAWAMDDSPLTQYDQGTLPQ